MRFVSSVLTVVWLALAAQSTLATQGHAEPRTAPQLGNRFHVEPTGLSLPGPYVRGKTPVVFVHGLWARPASWRRMIEARRRVDPGKTDPALDRMVLVGHSMGGLLCKLTAVDPGLRLWQAVSSRPAGEMTGAGKDIELTRDCLIFGADPGSAA